MSVPSGRIKIMHRLAEFERNRESILHAYSQIGILELRLRSKVPMALAEAKPKQEYWFENLRLNEKGVEDLKRARQQKPISPEDLLSLSFWRYLLSNRHYGELWLPHLHKAFPKVESPKSHGTFKAIDQAMNSSLRLRNKIAHYNLDELRSIEHSVKKTEWLIQIMGE
jgi:hypothetical protein